MATTTTTLRANALKTTNGFWWADLSSTDDAAAADFYGRVFGWSWDESPIGEGMVHRNAKLDNLMVAGLDPVIPGSGEPSAWTNFVFVDDINASAASITKLGGTIVMEPMDVMGEGWMAVALDPTGAAFGLWQPGAHTGADSVNQPNTYAWVELTTTDIEAAKRFYGELFGWGWDRIDTATGMEYWCATLEGRQFAGVMGKPEGMSDMPNAWVTYFGVADVAASAKDVAAAGGQVLWGPMPTGPGTSFGAVDPQGAFFVAMQLNEWPSE